MANVEMTLVGNDANFPARAASEAHEQIGEVANYLKAVNAGFRAATSLKVRNSAVAATGTLTLVTCLAGTEIEVNGVKFRAIASGTPTVANGEFVISGTDAADATSLVAAINGSTDARIVGVLTASSTGASGVVTITPTQPGVSGNAITIKTNGVVASGTATAAAVDVDDAITINGVSFTAKQQRATGTLTAVSSVAGDTFSINGNTFTAVAGAVVAGTLQFSIDTGNTETAASIAAQINAFVGLSGVVTATSASNVVTIRAVNAGTAGNSITLTGTAVKLAASAATLENGAAVAEGEFEAIGTNTQVATDLARCINAHTSALITGHVEAVSTAAVVTIWAKYPGTAGNNITLATSDATDLAVAVTNGRLAGGTDAGLGGTQATATVTLTSAANTETVLVNGVTITAHTNTDANNQFRIDGDDTADAAALARAINNSTTAALAEVIATSSSNVVTIKARKGGVHGNAITLSSAAGTMVCSAARLATGAVPTSVVPSGARLGSGTETLTTYTL